MDDVAANRRWLVSGFAAVVAAFALALGAGSGGAADGPQLERAAGVSERTAAAAVPERPPIVKRLIPYGAKRKRDMAAYSKRHYGKYKWRLGTPKLIVQHFAVAGSIDAIYNTFAPNRPDAEYGELPGTCSHFAIGADGTIVKFVRTDVRCRHVVGLNHVSIGIEHVGFSDGEVMNRPAQLQASLALTDWLRCRYGLGIKRVIGHHESLSSPFYRELDPDLRGRTHGDFKRATMQVYRGKIRSRASC
jgi:N-acetylmuramoyl-L-alanine amidase